MDKSKIDFAGVVSGAKMFVRTVDGPPDSAAAAVVGQNREVDI
jgi:hypothetical protein